MQKNEALTKLKKLRASDYEMCLDSLPYFVRTAWKILEPTKPLLWNWHHSLICEYLEALDRGQITRLVINIPPRYLKSLLCTVCYPAWVWIREPATRFIFASYSDSLSTKHSKDRRDLIESDWYRGGWWDKFSLSTDQNVKTEFVNDKRGHMIATSMLGTATGKGGDYVVIDDPHDPKKAESDPLRKSALEAYDRTFTTRLDDKKKGKILIVMQRLHEGDLSGHVLAQGGWEHLCLPAITEKTETYTYPTSRRTKTVQAGEALHETREPLELLEKQKANLGSYAFSGQYQQSPAPRGGGLIKTIWWQFYKQAPEKFDEIIQSWDLTFKGVETSDFVCGQVWGRKGASKYLLDMVHRRMGFNETIVSMKALSRKWEDAHAKYIEDAANAQAALAVLKVDHIPGLILVKPIGSKESRVMSVLPDIEAGNVFLPDPTQCAWVSDFLDECAKFPLGLHDDMVDAMSLALGKMRHAHRTRLAMVGLGIEKESVWLRE